MNLSKWIKPYTGVGDVGTWIKKFKMVAKHQKIEDMASVLPLLLEDSAFLVYDNLSEKSQASMPDIEKSLLDAFSIDPFQAYENFRSRNWKDEPVDVFLGDLQRLAMLAGIADERLIKSAFVVGLPSTVSHQLRASTKIFDVELSEIVRQARSLMTEVIESPALVAMNNGMVRNADVNCFGCGKKGHYRNACTSKIEMKCWTCGNSGHTSRRCRLNQQGNAERGTGAPAVSQ